MSPESSTLNKSVPAPSAQPDVDYYSQLWGTAHETSRSLRRWRLARRRAVSVAGVAIAVLVFELALGNSDGSTPATADATRPAAAAAAPSGLGG